MGYSKSILASGSTPRPRLLTSKTQIIINSLALEVLVSQSPCVTSPCEKQEAHVLIAVLGELCTLHNEDENYTQVSVSWSKCQAHQTEQPEPSICRYTGQRFES